MNSISVVKRAISIANLQNSVLPEEIDGLFWLNAVLSLKDIQKNINPYYRTYSFQSESGKSDYFIRGLIEPVTLRYYINGIPYQLNYIGRNAYFGGSIIKNIKSLPTNWHAEKVANGFIIYLYMAPSSEYEFELMGKFSIPNPIDETFELDEVLDKWYQIFLIFELAETLCLNRNITMPPSAKQYLIKLRIEISKNNFPDATQKKLSVFDDSYQTNSIMSNILQSQFGSGGWLP